MARHRNLHIILCMFISFINTILNSIVLANDKMLKSAAYFKMSFELKYNLEVILKKEMWFGSHRYIVGGDECMSEASYLFSSEDCASPHMALNCKGYYIDANESNFLANTCGACASGLKESYRYFVIHTSLHLFTLYLLPKRLDARQDSPFLKQLTMLVSLASFIACLESAQLNSSCITSASSTITLAFDSPEITASSSYSSNATQFSLVYSFLLFIVLTTTRSIPTKERKEVRNCKPRSDELRGRTL